MFRPFHDFNSSYLITRNLIEPCRAADWWGGGDDCYEGSTWPKLIGYGKGDTEILSIDRRDSDGMLAMMVKSDEPDLIGNAFTEGGDKAGSGANTRAYTVYDPDTEQYIWLKVVIGAVDNDYP